MEFCVPNEYHCPGGGGVLPYFTCPDVPLNRMSFYGKKYATGCPYLTKIMRQGITIAKKVMQPRVSCGRTCLEFS